MARSRSTIYKSFEDALIAFAATAGITIVPSNWSQTDFKRMFLETSADAHAIQEQLYDSCISDTESVASTLPSLNENWWRHQMLNVFEYDAVAVPIVQLDSTTNFAPYYPNPNPSFRIVKYCSVVPGGLGTTTIKVAGVGPAQITGLELAAIQSFINTVGGPGMTFNAQSKDSDKLFMQIDVYYTGLYSSVIQGNVIAAIDAYLASLSQGGNLNGKVDLSDFMVAIKAVPGVKSVVFVNIQARADLTAFGAGTDLMLNKTEVQKDYQTDAGYIVSEVNVGKTLTDFRSGAAGPLNLNLIPL